MIETIRTGIINKIRVNFFGVLDREREARLSLGFVVSSVLKLDPD